MNHVFGKMVLDVMIPVKAESETLGLLEANYKLNPDRIIGFELFAVDCKGHRFKVHVMNCVSDLDEFVG